MRKHYPWLLFDADGTLFDYNLAEITALKNAFQLLGLNFKEEYLDIYRRINHALWQALERQEIKPEVLRVQRFEKLLETLQLTGSPDQMSTTYVEQLALCTDLIDGAYEVLQTMREKSRIAILTNGLQTVQHSRLARSTIRDIISELIISEEVGAAKPHAAYFDAAFTRLGNPSKRDALLIGDSLTSDIQGGVDYGIDTCWYNHTGEPRPEDLQQITFEIKHLRELLDVLD